jgi:hypothetical protein
MVTVRTGLRGKGAAAFSSHRVARRLEPKPSSTAGVWSAAPHCWQWVCGRSFTWTVIAAG